MQAASERERVDGRLVVSARAAAAGAVLLYVTDVVVDVIRVGMDAGELAYTAAYGIVGVGFAVLSLAIIQRFPRHAIGWIFLGVTVFIGLTVLASTIAWATEDPRFGEWLGHWAWLPVIAVPVAFVPLLFPDGRLPGPRWRWVLWVSSLGLFGFLLNIMFGQYLGGVEDYGRNPYHHPTLSDLGLLVAWLFPLGWLGSIAAAVVRYRRARGLARQQVKWPFFGAMMAFVVIVFVSVASAVFDVDEDAADLLVIGALVAIPTSVGLGIVRYRLYDIDRLISRTVAYSIVVGVLGALYASLVTVLGLSTPFGDDFTVAVSTLSAAALFQLLRSRVMRWVDRRFHRLPYDPEQVGHDLRMRLGREVNVNRIGEEFAVVVQEALEPEFVGIWFSSPR